jgi:hypothetical protein
MTRDDVLRLRHKVPNQGPGSKLLVNLLREWWLAAHPTVREWKFAKTPHSWGRTWCAKQGELTPWKYAGCTCPRWAQLKSGGDFRVFWAVTRPSFAEVKAALVDPPEGCFVPPLSAVQPGHEPYFDTPEHAMAAADLTLVQRGALTVQAYTERWDPPTIDG